MALCSIRVRSSRELRWKKDQKKNASATKEKILFADMATLPQPI